MRLLLVPALIALAACSTPQERCISNAGKNLRVLEKLIATTRGNLQRGFAIETETVFVNTEQVCGQDSEGEDIICEIPVAEENKVPVAIDLNAERQKLESLLAQRTTLLSTRDADIAQCIALYPEA